MRYMKTHEVEKLLGINKQTLYFYEKEALIHPQREINGYRDYDETDIKTLKLIKTLRDLDFSIDDIRLVLHRDITFQECLEKKVNYLDDSLKEINEVKLLAEMMKEKEVPVLSEVKEMQPVYPYQIGLKKTTKKVSLGRRKTRDFLIKELRNRLILAVLMLGACYIGFSRALKGFISLPWAMLTGICVCIALFAELLKDDRFIEFDEQGISYHLYHDIKAQWRYLGHILKNEDEQDIQHVRYEDICKVEVKVVRRYLKIPMTNLPMHMYTIDLKFYFPNGDEYFLLNPLMLEHDQQWMAAILLEKVSAIDDKEEALKALAQGKALNDWMKEKI